MEALEEKDEARGSMRDFEVGLLEMTFTDQGSGR